jgi:protein TonB
VQFGLDEFGRVVEPRVEYASPRGVFEKNVLEALQQSRFKPLLVNGEATPVTELTETFLFQLLDEHPPPLG